MLLLVWLCVLLLLLLFGDMVVTGLVVIVGLSWSHLGLILVSSCFILFHLVFILVSSWLHLGFILNNLKQDETKMAPRWYQDLGGSYNVCHQ